MAAKPPTAAQLRKVALAQLKADGSWSDALAPLLDEYIAAIGAARALRAAGDLAAARGEGRRALALAEALMLTPRSRKMPGRPRKERDDDSPEPDRFAALDELAPRRANRRRP